MSPCFWSVDLHHSNFIFQVKHMLISTATGHFKDFHIDVSTNGDDFEQAQIAVSIATNSVSTNESYRDEHIKSDAFFSSNIYPNIIFNSTQFTRKNQDIFTLSGKLQIKDIMQEITFPVKHIGTVHYDDHIRAAFEADFAISRKDFNLTYSSLMETGGMVLADEVFVTAHVSLVRKLKH